MVKLCISARHIEARPCEEARIRVYAYNRKVFRCTCCGDHGAFAVDSASSNGAISVEVVVTVPQASMALRADSFSNKLSLTVVRLLPSDVWTLSVGIAIELWIMFGGMFLH